MYTVDGYSVSSAFQPLNNYDYRKNWKPMAFPPSYIPDVVNVVYVNPIERVNVRFVSSVHNECVLV